MRASANIRPYTLIRSERRTLSLEITPACEIVARAPRRASKRDIERFIIEREDWIASHLEQMRLRAEAFPEPDDAERERLISLAKTLLPGKVERYAAIMGLCPAGITVTGARTRFGSCSAKNRLSFSWRLMRYPDAAVDYVVVHELAHIRHKNHGPEFYALIAAVLPDHKARRKMLK